MKTLNILDIGIAPYEDTHFLQKQILRKKKRSRCEDYIILVEHPAVFTIGRSGSKDNILVREDLLSENGLKVIEIDRGGDITFHGPGQLVAYPVFDLRNHVKDIRLFIKNLERVLELTMYEYGFAADREKKYTGLWTGGGKIGFIGIGISNWITYHGVSINANVDLKWFSMIKPCGIDNLRVTSLREMLGRDIDINRLKDTFIEKCCEVFDFGRSNRLSTEAFMAKEETA